MIYCGFTTDNTESDIHLFRREGSYYLSVVSGKEYCFDNPYDTWTMLQELRQRGRHIPECALTRLRPEVIRYAEQEVLWWSGQIGLPGDRRASEKVKLFSAVRLELAEGVA